MNSLTLEQNYSDLLMSIRMQEWRATLCHWMELEPIAHVWMGVGEDDFRYTDTGTGERVRYHGAMATYLSRAFP